MKPTLSFTQADLERAFSWVCQQRKHMPANADIWHLRFHWSAMRTPILTALNDGNYQLRPLRLFDCADGTTRALWDAQDALVLRALTEKITPVLPINRACEHIAGHRGGASSVKRVSEVLQSGPYHYVCRTDIKGYYANMARHLLYAQLCSWVSNIPIRRLLWQFLHYSVEDAGRFHTPSKGIARGSSLSPLLGACHLTFLDDLLCAIPGIRYVRYMDDFLILTRTRWQLRRVVACLNHALATLGFALHPAKTFIGAIKKGFDWMGCWFNENGVQRIAPRALSNHRQVLRRLYERTRHLAPERRQFRVAQYLSRWSAWCRARCPGIARAPSTVSITSVTYANPEKAIVSL